MCWKCYNLNPDIFFTSGQILAEETFVYHADQGPKDLSNPSSSDPAIVSVCGSE